MSSPETGTTSFPAGRHILRDLRMEMEAGPDAFQAVRMPLVPEILGADGHLQPGVVATIADLAAAFPTMQHVLPDWMATSDLSACTTARPMHGPILALPRVLRAGRTSVVTEVEVFDEGCPEQTRVGHCLLAFARIERPASTRNMPMPESPSERTRSTMALSDSAMRAPHHEQTGIRVVDAARGICELARTDYVLNSFGTVQGGSVATITEAGAEALVSASTGRAASAVDLSVRYLAQGPRGPYRTSARLLRLDEAAGQAWAQVELRDIGADTLMSLAKVALQLSS